MTRRWVVLLATMAFVAAMFVTAPEQAADVLKALAPIWLVDQ